MKPKIMLCFAMLAAIALAPTIAADHPPTMSPNDSNLNPCSWGEPVKGLRLGLTQVDTLAGTEGSFDLLISIENTSKDDVILNLGMMLVNGKNQYPTALYLLLTSADGNTQTLPYQGPAAISGRVDTFVVPLPDGATYTLRCSLNKFSLTPIPSGQYKLTVGFKGQSAKNELIPDWWIGSLHSGEQDKSF